MTSKQILLSVVTAATLTLSGCGSSGEETAASISGIFNDAPVQGLPYTCSPSNIQGDTSEEGKYTCKEGDNVSFTLGAITLGPILATNAQVVTPYTFFPNDNTAAVNLAQLLQSLDDDGFYEDVIKIDLAKLSAVVQDLNFTDPDFDANATEMFAGTGVSLVDNETAEQHLIENTDTIVPVVTLNGEATVHIDEGDTYEDDGATAEDNLIGALTPIKSGSVNTNIPGTYTIIWTATDTAGNAGTAERTVIVDAVDSIKPVITLNGDATVHVALDDTYIDAGATATDDVDGEITAVMSGSVDTSTAGTYIITYTATDVSNNVETVERTVIVDPLVDSVKPVITLNGDATVHVALDATYIDAGATANDNVDGAITAVMSGSVDTSTAGTYIITYTATDASNNVETAERTVIVDAAVCQNVNPLTGACEDVPAVVVCQNVNPITGSCED
ncbi:MAG: DUF5011 domain-containing protein [Sulfurovum sp.]|nr:DUF5011 domain-containing protein [Sulfurovum sp.]